MTVPKGMKVFSRTHRYKAGEQLPEHVSKALEKKINKKPDTFQTGKASGK